MKRKCPPSTGQEVLNELSGVVAFTSFNFQKFAWGFQPSAAHLTIIRNQASHQPFEVITSGKSSFYLRAVGGPSNGDYLLVDADSKELILSRDRSCFFMEVCDIVGTNLLVRIRTRDMLYIRHSNYILRADERSSTDRPWEEDSLWWVRLAGRIDENSPKPETEERRFNRPLFIHMKTPLATQENSVKLSQLLETYISLELSESSGNNRISNLAHGIKSYPLQGAGGMGEARAMAVSMFRPGKPVSESLQHRIESATTVKSRGGMASFTRPPDEVSDAVRRLSVAALREMKRMRMFGLVSRRSFELELGFCEWVLLPHGSEIVPHRDGGNDCDVAAIFCVRNKSECTVEGTSIELDRGEMYIFEPQKYFHSVGKPQFPGPRIILALRFFRVHA